MESGLTADVENWTDHASDAAMALCCENTIDTTEQDLLGIASHIAALAEMIVWILRPENAPWERPEPIAVGKHTWTPICFRGATDRVLRQIAIVDRVNELELLNSWEIRGEMAVYDMPMALIVVNIGQLRNGRWKCPLAYGYRHPQAKDLRFKKRDESQFGENWTRVFREADHSTTDEWFEGMVHDGVLTECVNVMPCEIPVDSEEIVKLIERKLDRIHGLAEVPEPQPSMCFNRISPCPFRHVCREGPSEDAGFIKV